MHPSFSSCVYFKDLNKAFLNAKADKILSGAQLLLLTSVIIWRAKKINYTFVQETFFISAQFKKIIDITSDINAVLL